MKYLAILALATAVTAAPIAGLPGPFRGTSWNVPPGIEGETAAKEKRDDANTDGFPNHGWKRDDANTDGFPNHGWKKE